MVVSGNTDAGDRVSQERRATVRDVAARAGVSPGTVSKALNGTGQISAADPGTDPAAAEEIDFRAERAGPQRVRTAQLHVGMITTDSFERFSVPVMLGAEDALGAGRISVFLCDSRDDPIRERHYVDVLLGRRVDGFIVTGRTFNRRPPLAGDCRRPGGLRADTVFRPRRLLHRRRRRRGRPPGGRTPAPDGTDPDRPRHRTGVLRAARRRPTASGQRSPAPARADRTAVRRLDRGLGPAGDPHPVACCPEIDAIHYGSDLLARGVADALRELGTRIPEDVAIIGTDNWELHRGRRPPATDIGGSATGGRRPGGRPTVARRNRRTAALGTRAGAVSARRPRVD